MSDPPDAAAAGLASSLHSVLLTALRGFGSIKDIKKEYKDLEGRNLDEEIAKCGITDTNAFLNMFPNFFRRENEGWRAVPSESSNVQKLMAVSKKKKGKSKSSSKKSEKDDNEPEASGSREGTNGQSSRVDQKEHDGPIGHEDRQGPQSSRTFRGSNNDRVNGNDREEPYSDDRNGRGRGTRPLRRGASSNRRFANENRISNSSRGTPYPSPSTGNGRSMGNSSGSSRRPSNYNSSNSRRTSQRNNGNRVPSRGMSSESLQENSARTANRNRNEDAETPQEIQMDHDGQDVGNNANNDAVVNGGPDATGKNMENANAGIQPQNQNSQQAQNEDANVNPADKRQQQASALLAYQVSAVHPWWDLYYHDPVIPHFEPVLEEVVEERNVADDFGENRQSLYVPNAGQILPVSDAIYDCVRLWFERKKLDIDNMSDAIRGWQEFMPENEQQVSCIHQLLSTFDDETISKVEFDMFVRKKTIMESFLKFGLAIDDNKAEPEVVIEMMFSRMKHLKQMQQNIEKIMAKWMMLDLRNSTVLCLLRDVFLKGTEADVIEFEKKSIIDWNVNVPDEGKFYGDQPKFDMRVRSLKYAHDDAYYGCGVPFSDRDFKLDLFGDFIRNMKRSISEMNNERGTMVVKKKYVIPIFNIEQRKATVLAENAEPEKPLWDQFMDIVNNPDPNVPHNVLPFEKTNTYIYEKARERAEARAAAAEAAAKEAAAAEAVAAETAAAAEAAAAEAAAAEAAAAEAAAKAALREQGQSSSKSNASSSNSQSGNGTDDSYWLSGNDSSLRSIDVEFDDDSSQNVSEGEEEHSIVETPEPDVTDEQVREFVEIDPSSSEDDEDDDQDVVSAAKEQVRQFVEIDPSSSDDDHNILNTSIGQKLKSVFKPVPDDEGASSSTAAPGSKKKYSPFLSMERVLAGMLDAGEGKFPELRDNSNNMENSCSDFHRQFDVFLKNCKLTVELASNIALKYMEKRQTTLAEIRHLAGSTTIKQSGDLGSFEQVYRVKIDKDEAEKAYVMIMEDLAHRSLIYSIVKDNFGSMKMNVVLRLCFLNSIYKNENFFYMEHAFVKDMSVFVLQSEIVEQEEAKEKKKRPEA